MVQLLFRKLFRLIIVLLGTTLITFLLMHAIPGNPWSNYATSQRVQLNLGANMALQRELGHRFGLDLPLWRQYTRYIVGDFNEDGSFFCGAICGNLGPSIAQGGRSVLNVFFAPPEGMSFWKSQFGYSIRLVFFASLIAVGLGIPLGILSAIHPKSVISRTISVGLAALISIPNFVLGLLAIIILASWLKVIPVIPNWDIPGHWIMPAFVLAVMPMANIARMTRASLIHIINDDYVRTAHAKGLTERRVILVHVMRNALAPIVTYLGPTIMEMFTGLFVVESLYSFPGLGRGYWKAILDLDYPLIMGLTLIYAAGMMVANGLIELLGEALDPRIRAVKYQGAP